MKPYKSTVVILCEEAQMNVLVTGGSGRIGRYVVRELVSAGHVVTHIDLVRPQDELGGRFLRVDLTQAGQVYQALASSRAEAVVHLGAWANAGIVPDSRTYGDNVSGTFNLFQACADFGVRRVVSASSAQVYGFAQAPPLFVPVDEGHPLRPANCYALSKVVGEQAADYFVTNFGLTILSFRFMGVRVPAQIGPEIERMAQDPASGSRLLWTRTDARDAAVACRLAVEQEQVPSGPYNITGAQVVLSEGSAELVRRHLGAPTEIRAGLTGRVSPLSCARAESAFGYRPRFVWSETDRFLE
jgi:nucleoside-diphosphate-sugar epimerase